MDPIDALVELPTYRSEPMYEGGGRRPAAPAKKRATLLDRLVSSAGVDHVAVDFAALEADLDALRTA